MFSLGLMELLILVGLVVGLAYLLRNRALSRKALLALALLALGLLFTVLLRALIDEHLPAFLRVVAFVGLLAASALFILGEMRLFTPAGATFPGRLKGATGGRPEPPGEGRPPPSPPASAASPSRGCRWLRSPWPSWRSWL